MTRTHKKPALRSTSEPFYISRGRRSRPALLNNNRHTFSLPTLLFGPGFLSLALLLWPFLGTLPTTATTTTVHTAAVCPPISLLCTCLLFFLFLFFCLLPQLLTLSSRYPLNSTLLRVCVCSSLSVATFTALHRVLPFLLRYPTQPSTCSLNGARVSNTLKDVFKRNQKKRMLGLSQFLMGFTCKHTELLRTNA